MSRSPDHERQWVNPRDGKAWLIERAWVEPGPYRAAGAVEAERLLVPSVRFVHTPVGSEQTRVVTSTRPVRDDLGDIADEQILQLFDEAIRGGEE